jgi:large subunit ribosomal protein L13
MTEESSNSQSEDTSEGSFETHLREAVKDYNPEYTETSTLPEETILSRQGFLQIQENPSRVKGGNFEVDIIIDANYCIYGRLASYVAELALDGWSIAVVNVEKSIITGNPKNTISKFRKRTEVGSDQGPFYPKQPDQLFKRSVRGMLPYKKSRGREALDRIRAYIENPYDVRGIRIDEIYINTISTKDFIRLKSLSEELGAEQKY